MPNNNSIKWPQVKVLLTILILLGGIFLWTNTKADKTDVKEAEARVEKKVDKLQEAIQNDIKEIKENMLRFDKEIKEGMVRFDEKQDKMYDLLRNRRIADR